MNDEELMELVMKRYEQTFEKLIENDEALLMIEEQLVLAGFTIEITVKMTKESERGDVDRTGAQIEWKRSPDGGEKARL